ncbi:MAG TPA: LamG-like jellyroll fold domain-containing protein, partial [Chthoniobacteraceae bacterium]|nr:LamG-like jellyroll fold domain-containing protein [Chthoniobacteraceae bacterium]
MFFKKSLFGRCFTALLMAGTLPLGASDLAWWRFDGLNREGLVPDEVGEAHLKPRLQPVFEPGLYGNAVRLDQGRPHFSTPSRESVSLTDDFTMTCAVRPDWVKGYNVIVWKGDRSKTPEAINYYFGIRDGRLEFKYKDDANRWLMHTAREPLKAGQWYEVGVHFRQGEVEMVINGVLQELDGPDAASALPALFPNEAPMEVGEGAKPTVRAFEFNGLLDELR